MDLRLSPLPKYWAGDSWQSRAILPQRHMTLGRMPAAAAGLAEFPLDIRWIGELIDEFGIWPYDRDAATAFFSLVSARYERGSIILTSNKGFAEWGELLGDTVIATAILDRLLHHSHVLNIRGESYRLRDKRQAGLLTPHQLLNPSSEEPNNTKSQQGVGQY